MTPLQAWHLLATFTLLFLAGCGSTPPKPAPQSGGYYQDDGPGAHPPVNPDVVPDAVPRHEPPHRFANRPYVVLGRAYAPLAPGSAYRARGTASWYGRKYHGQKTSTGETYDMYAMTAAHATLPLPSYARVTHVGNGRSVVVRVNDRGPFHDDRVIDLSWTAAHKLGLLGPGSALVDVESIHPSGTLPTHDDLGLARAIAETTPPGPLPASIEQGRTWLQLGAFGQRENAENFLARMQRELADSPHAALLAMRGEAGLYRIRLGPFVDGAAARDAAELLRARFGLTAVPARP